PIERRPGAHAVPEAERIGEPEIQIRDRRSPAGRAARDEERHAGVRVEAEVAERGAGLPGEEGAGHQAETERVSARKLQDVGPSLGRSPVLFLLWPGVCSPPRKSGAAVP